MTTLASYALYGITLETDELLGCRLPVSRRQPDVRFVVGDPDPIDETVAVERYVTPPPSPDATSAFRFLHLPDRDVIQVVDSMDFHLSADRIVCDLIEPRHRFLVEINLLGLVLAFWLERRGTLTLHASAVQQRPGQAVAFIAAGGTGKSSLAAALVADGLPLVSEDLLVVRTAETPVMVPPGVPQLRLWPEQAARHHGDWEALPRPHPGFSKRRLAVGAGVGGIGCFAERELELRTIYALERRSERTGSPRIESVTGYAAAVELLRHSYLPHESSAFGWQPRRLGQIADLLRTVPVRRLVYPSGLEHLEAIRDLLLTDTA